MGAVYTAQLGLHEATQTVEAMRAGANKGLEDIAGVGTELQKAALRAGFGETISPASVQKLVDSIVSYQAESLQMIEDLRGESTRSAAEIERIVEDGKNKSRAAVTKFLTAPSTAPSAG